LRFSAGGVQPAVAVTPDMAVFAKSLSNGYAMGAVVGRRTVMEPAARMFISSTYWSDTVGLRAALTTLRRIRERDVPARLRHTGQTLQTRLNDLAGQTGCPVRCTGLDVHPQLKFAIDDERLRSQVSTLYIQEMARRGCHGYTSFYLNAAQGEAEIEQTLAAAGETFALIADALRQGSVEQKLECMPGEESFHRLVR